MGAGTIERGGGGGKRRRSHGKRKPMSEINVTPFVDVMLVLLIIFMVAAPLLTVGVPIELPKTAATPLPSEAEEPLSISITQDGIILLQNEDIDPVTLITKLRAIAAERDDDKVFLRADGNVPYQQVMEIMGALNAGGFKNIGLVTDAGGPTLDAETQ
jgi:biopolymer transport protein TolR